MKTLLIILIMATNSSRGAAIDHIEFKQRASCLTVLMDMKNKLGDAILYGECLNVPE